MGVKIYDQQQITGLTISGTTDGAGSWTIGVDTSAQLSSMPVNSPGLLIKVSNTNASPRWAGIRTTGVGTAEFQKDMTGNSSEFWFIPFTLPDSDLDFYLESTDVTFRVICALDELWVLFPIASRPTVPSTGTSWLSRTLTDCAENSAVITTGSRWRPTGETTNLTNALSGQQLVKLDGSKAVEFNTGGASLSVIGYHTGTTTWPAWLSDTVSYTANSSWQNAATSYPGKRLLFLQWDKTGAGFDIDFRARGSSYNPTSAGVQVDESFFSPMDASGQWDYFAETGSTGTLYALATIPDVETAAINITNIDQLIAGEESVLTVDSPLVIDSVSVSDGSVTVICDAVSIDDENANFFAPEWTDGEVGLKYGAVTVTATDGTDITEPYSDDIGIESGYSVVTLDSVSPSNYGAIATPPYSPALEIGSQVRFNPLEITVSLNGVVGSVGDFEGVSSIADLTGGVVRFGTITVSGGGGVVTDGALTSISLTSIGLTSISPTSVGL